MSWGGPIPFFQIFVTVDHHVQPTAYIFGSFERAKESARILAEADKNIYQLRDAEIVEIDKGYELRDGNNVRKYEVF